ncbi:NADH dehydrogenase [ubiquinone] 1 alpha subcomplex subunit 8-B [Galdieria sulphuraria]|uniref:NADH dehydrogenase (Ubiquinone) 1 alpha subcomplex 8 isoform 1 n=1 Tax=Galdieria sulphuraria TaxID=130081 RepID=M2Y9Z0_GALSU|nr:NADH dehydrogenase (ubiquinone) 1 alpha subcomplex 8 isoform 1 [Galdieria sulphuraria]EME32699.1 NADH dehydrogenase (ubiquinone) 1 alpha subcomplex 8 isoform 1 [Galdieria sulphuraria]GJD07901.1 NADH dehydrogenase [ubiquinone] 1 alpha subcomplex subunit 8-B [Galdieria sulphuraria]|eukprot:XP_005709219.1 NADH dehydrogenase (ubiquinone) 1 alpha subcomplex 8 isoform 1 [Galdieria sulphuraria]
MSSTDERPLTTSSVLYAAAREIGRRCAKENRAFLECKSKEDNPEECLREGEKVTNCVLQLLKELNATCPKEFEDYSACLDRQSSQLYLFDRCRKFERSLVSCRASFQSDNQSGSSLGTSETAPSPNM